MKRIFRSLGWVVVGAAVAGHLPAADDETAFDPTRLEREIIVPAASDPVALDFGPAGEVYFIERPGGIKCWDPATRSTRLIGRVPSLTKSDAGCLGFVLARDFASTGHFFLLYVPESGTPELRVSRFTMRDGQWLDGSERVLLALPLQGGDGPAHCGGGLAWDAAGNLLVGTGDNSPPQDVPAVHPEEAPRDSRRTAGNSQELRGKILRITPTADGGYRVPSGNMFADPAQGRPEIFVMGARNPFRIAVDEPTGWVIWGDVGGNVDPSFDLGPEGYDELNLTKAPGFYGWPFCSGPNAPWRSFDPKTRRPRGEFFDPSHPTNDSPANTGLKQLPPAVPALLWYPTSPSTEWPQLGSGGRSITGGPLYRFDRYPGSKVRLPRHFDGAVLWGDWMRNFLAAARLSADGTLTAVDRLMPETIFRKPADLRLGPDGALYVAEYGDAWAGNTNGQITRVIYRRGNRPPRAVAATSALAGPAPLRVEFNGHGSSDPETTDNSQLDYTWRFQDGSTAAGPKVSHVFETPGRRVIELVVRDPEGAEGRSMTLIDVGNAPPLVRITRPLDGGFIDYGVPFDYRVDAADPEDGPLGPDKVSLLLERRDRVSSEDESIAYPGLVSMRAGTCFACHRTAEPSAGPGYADIAKKYISDPASREVLAQKILRGGSGVWGEIPMPPHPQVSIDQARLMVDWILSLASRDTRRLPPGLAGRVAVDPPPREWGAFSNGVVLLTASATDAGTAEAPPLSTESRITLRTRRQMAAAFDRGHRVSTQHNLESGLVARVTAGGWFAFDRIRLADVTALRLQLQQSAGAPARLEVRSHRPDGPLLGSGTLPASDPSNRRRPALTLQLPAPDSSVNEPVDLVFALVGDADAVCDIEWIEFK